ncbi:MAG: hypothetical protein LVQ97_02925 [Candidatus Micrarchaeales archaeon]|jgi:hypothetical protein|uniref:Uncharacterized protein n=1 Tax=Candidatus Micrarchaeum acidiphilum ARMAN-2 TaxID=425595 RepID=C7DGE6_MICA2|nr:MAG: hypothetical protein UNLARM2_0150 [Candidatus Micrarchaeum acidiphilum ARMAN-2]MCW6161113.1 hypothetical protein [Candidatus Micrarchaeales archaeon]
MDKRFIYAGLVLVVIAIVSIIIVFDTVSSVSQAPPSILKVVNFTVGSNSYYYSGFVANGSYIVLALISSKRPLNFYLLNSSTFGEWASYMGSNTSVAANASGFAYAKGLVGKGAVTIFRNATNVTMPYISTYAISGPYYQSNSSNISIGELPHGKYYVVADNTFGSASHNSSVNTTMLIYSPDIKVSSLRSYGYTVVAGGTVSVLAIISGIVLLIIGLLKRGPKGSEGKTVRIFEDGAPSAMSDEEINKVYDKIERKRGVQKGAKRQKLPRRGKSVKNKNSHR